MVTKITKSMVIAILVLMPFTNLLAQFSPYQPGGTLSGFLIASLCYAMAAIALVGLYIFLSSKPKVFLLPGILLFSVGLVFTPALMMGPPELGANLLHRTSEEHVRFGLLMLATILLAGGTALVFTKRQPTLAIANKVMTILLLAATALLLWDNFTSYHFSNELLQWVEAGKDGATFFTQYDFQNFERTLGRSLLYIIAIWVAYVLFKQNVCGKVALILISIFCYIGFAFFFVYNFVDPEYYSPFMIPAIAMTPAYWCGLSILTNGQRT